MTEEITPQDDFQERLARGENPFAAAMRPMQNGSTEIRPGHIGQQFVELRRFLSAQVLPDLEAQLSNLQENRQKGIPCAAGKYESLDLDVHAPLLGMTESGSLALTLHQQDKTSTGVLLRPYRLEKHMSVEMSTDFGYGKKDGGTYLSLSTHGRGYPYREQMSIGATAQLFSGQGRVSIVHEYDVNEEGNAPASSIELRFYDDSDTSRFPDHIIATYRRIGEKLVLDEKEHWLGGVKKMGVQLPQEVIFQESKGLMNISIPSRTGESQAATEMRILFPEQLSPSTYIEAVKNGKVDETVLGGFIIS